MTLPQPDTVRGWITSSYSSKDLRAASYSHAVQEAIANEVCQSHGINDFDDRLKVLYHVEDITQEME